MTDMIKTAEISPCGQYRWSLTRRWGPPGRSVCFVMLNPSTADAEKDDPTLKACIHFAKSWGFGQLEVVNLFPFRSSDPAECYEWCTTVGDGEAEVRNLNYVARASCTSELLVAAWGAVPWAADCGDFVTRFTTLRKPLYCLGTTKDGAPKHPLARGGHRIPRDQKPIIWRPQQS